MEQYIPKSAVVAEIENLLDNESKYFDEYDCAYRDGNNAALYRLKEKLDTIEVKEVGVDFGDPKVDKSEKCIIDTKTIEMKDVDLDKLLTGFMSRYAYENGGEYPSAIEIAKHFFELGLRYKSSYVSIPSIDDTLKEMGVDPDSKEAKSFKESYYMALDKLWDKFKEKQLLI